MSTSNSTEVIGKAVIVGAIAMLTWSSAPAVALCTGVASAFCVGRWFAKKWQQPG